MNLFHIFTGAAIIYLLIKQHQMAKTIQEVKDEMASFKSDVATFKAAVDTEQEQVAAALKKLQDQIDAGSGATPEQLQELFDELTSARTELQDAKADLEGTVNEDSE